MFCIGWILQSPPPPPPPPPRPLYPKRQHRHRHKDGYLMYQQVQATMVMKILPMNVYGHSLVSFVDLNQDNLTLLGGIKISARIQ